MLYQYEQATTSLNVTHQHLWPSNLTKGVFWLTVVLYTLDILEEQSNIS